MPGSLRTNLLSANGDHDMDDLGAEENFELDEDDDPTTNPLYRKPRKRRSTPGPLPLTPVLRRASSDALAAATPQTPGTAAWAVLPWSGGDGEFLLTDPRIYAQQITLMDFEAFEKIREEELKDLGFSKKDKAELAPNVTFFTQRFNQLSSWLIDEILQHEACGDRAKALTHCIKLAKALRELNNLHGLLAVLSSLRSAPINRLKKTWQGVESKRRKHFDALETFMAKENNYEKLRTHVATCAPPCIPYLGIYKMDLLHLEVAEGDATGCRQDEAQEVIAAVLKFQFTPYAFAPIAAIQDRLIAQEYPMDDKKAIREIEDRAYARSQQVEPKDKPKTLPYPPRGDRGSTQLTVSRDDSDLMPYSGTPAKKGHRKAKSLGNSLAFTRECLLNEDSEAFDFSSNGSIDSLPSKDPPPPVRHSMFSAINVGTDASGKRTPSVLITDDDVGPDGRFATPCDADTSQSEDEADAVNGSPLRATTMASTREGGSDAAEMPSVLDTDAEFLFQGTLQRKGARLGSYKQYWIGVTRSHLVFFPRKDKGSGRSAYSDKPLKMKSIVGAVLLIGDPSLDRKFALRLASGKMLQFKADSSKDRTEWLIALRAALGIAAADVQQLETAMTPPVRRRYFTSRKKTPADVASSGGDSSPPSSTLSSPSTKRKKTPTSTPTSSPKPSPRTGRRHRMGKAPSPPKDVAPMPLSVPQAATGPAAGPSSAAANPAPTPVHTEGEADGAAVSTVASTKSDDDFGTVVRVPLKGEADHTPSETGGEVKPRRSTTRTDSNETVFGFGSDTGDSQSALPADASGDPA